MSQSKESHPAPAAPIPTCPIDEAMIRNLVHTFYGRVRADDLIGPIFDARVANWDEHLPRMCDFWSSVMLATGRFHGQPMKKHLPLPIDAKHFDRWLELFEKTCEQVCPPDAAARFLSRARNIAQSLELGIASSHGAVVKRGERYEMPVLAAERPRLKVASQDRPESARLPKGLTAYKRTNEFTEDSLPAGLRREHRTKAGVWGVIHVLEGRLRYRVLAPQREVIVEAGQTAVIEPEQLHEVEPVGGVRMFVEFHRS